MSAIIIPLLLLQEQKVSHLYVVSDLLECAEIDEHSFKILQGYEMQICSCQLENEQLSSQRNAEYCE
jgi:hypothetical protein